MILVDTALRTLCGSEARFRLIKALYGAPNKRFHLRGLAGAAGVDPSQVAKLLPQFVQAGLCEELPDAPFKRYCAARTNPLTQALLQVFADADPAAEEGELVNLKEAPVLRSLLWTGRERTHIPAREAFKHYESQWRHIREADLGKTEKRLVERLKKDYGRGLING
jgi:DNA-binding MarR family transcriptional regulator